MARIISSMTHYCPPCKTYGRGVARSDGQVIIQKDCLCGRIGQYIRDHLKAPYREFVTTTRLQLPSAPGTIPIGIEAGCRVVVEKLSDGTERILNVRPARPRR